MFHLTGSPEEASAQLIAHLVRLENTVDWWITELYRELNELHELHNEMMKKNKHGPEHSGGIRTEEQRHQEGGGRSGDSHGNAQDGGGGEETDAQ